MDVERNIKISLIEDPTADVAGHPTVDVEYPPDVGAPDVRAAYDRYDFFSSSGDAWCAWCIWPAAKARVKVKLFKVCSTNL